MIFRRILVPKYIIMFQVNLRSAYVGRINTLCSCNILVIVSLLWREQVYTVKYSLSTREIQKGKAPVISWWLRLYFTAYPTSSHNTEITDFLKWYFQYIHTPREEQGLQRCAQQDRANYDHQTWPWGRGQKKSVSDSATPVCHHLQGVRHWDVFLLFSL